jgi:hypothetical protein
MADTTIKVNSNVRDRLAVLARQRGCTLGELVADLAAKTPTEEELNERYAAAADYIQRNLYPGFDDADRLAGEQLWRDLDSGRVTAI